jgi:hypothetical protein
MRLLFKYGVKLYLNWSRLNDLRRMIVKLSNSECRRITSALDQFRRPVSTGVLLHAPKRHLNQRPLSHWLNLTSDIHHVISTSQSHEDRRDKLSQRYRIRVQLHPSKSTYESCLRPDTETSHDMLTTLSHQ